MKLIFIKFEVHVVKILYQYIKKQTCHLSHFFQPNKTKQKQTNTNKHKKVVHVGIVTVAANGAIH